MKSPRGCDLLEGTPLPEIAITPRDPHGKAATQNDAAVRGGIR
jgi:hypothetical protein